jgi:hypothetical protein
LYWGYIETFTKVLTYIKYIIVELTPSIIVLSPPPPIPGIVLQVSFSTDIHVYTVFVLYSLSQMLSPHHPLLQVQTPSGRDCSALLFSNFIKIIF